MADDMPPLMRDVALFTARMGIFAPGSGGADVWKRLRLAVTPEEHEQLCAWAFDRGDNFYNRIRNIPLTVEAEPLKPPLIVAYAPRKIA